MRYATTIGLLILAWSTTATAQEVVRPGIGLSFAMNQTGSPLQILRVTSSDSVLFEKVAVRNTSSQQVARLRFGVSLAHLDGGVPRAILPGEPVSTALAPGDEVVLEARVLPRAAALAALAEAGANAAQADLGLLEVQFGDGTAWTYVPDPALGFRPTPADAFPVPRRCDDSASAASKQRPTSTLGYFSCAISSDCLICTNYGTSCTMSPCGSYGQPPCSNCPQQVCWWNP